MKKEKIKAIINDSYNRIFFNNAKFHGDMGYTILYKNGEELFAVKTKLTGMVYYKLNGTKIGNYTNLFSI